MDDDNNQNNQNNHTNIRVMERGQQMAARDNAKAKKPLAKTTPHQSSSSIESFSHEKTPTAETLPPIPSLPNATTATENSFSGRGPPASITLDNSSTREAPPLRSSTPVVRTNTSTTDTTSPHEYPEAHQSLLELGEETMAQAMLIFLLADLRILSATGRIRTKFEHLALDSDRSPRLTSRDYAGFYDYEDTDGVSSSHIMAILLVEILREAEDFKEAQRQKSKSGRRRRRRRRRAQPTTSLLSPWTATADAGHITDARKIFRQDIRAANGMPSLLHCYNEMLSEDVNPRISRVSRKLYPLNEDLPQLPDTKTTSFRLGKEKEWKTQERTVNNDEEEYELGATSSLDQDEEDLEWGEEDEDGFPTGISREIPHEEHATEEEGTILVTHAEDSKPPPLPPKASWDVAQLERHERRHSTLGSSKSAGGTSPWHPSTKHQPSPRTRSKSMSHHAPQRASLVAAEHAHNPNTPDSYNADTAIPVPNYPPMTPNEAEAHRMHRRASTNFQRSHFNPNVGQEEMEEDDDSVNQLESLLLRPHKKPDIDRVCSTSDVLAGVGNDLCSSRHTTTAAVGPGAKEGGALVAATGSTMGTTETAAAAAGVSDSAPKAPDKPTAVASTMAGNWMSGGSEHRPRAETSSTTFFKQQQETRAKFMATMNASIPTISFKEFSKDFRERMEKAIPEQLAHKVKDLTKTRQEKELEDIANVQNQLLNWGNSEDGDLVDEMDNDSSGHLEGYIEEEDNEHEGDGNDLGEQNNDESQEASKRRPPPRRKKMSSDLRKFFQQRKGGEDASTTTPFSVTTTNATTSARKKKSHKMKPRSDTDPTPEIKARKVATDTDDALQPKEARTVPLDRANLLTAQRENRQIPEYHDSNTIQQLMLEALDKRDFWRLNFIKTFFREGTVSYVLANSRAEMVWLSDWHTQYECTYAISIDREKRKVLLAFRGAYTESDWRHIVDWYDTATSNPVKDDYPNRPTNIRLHGGFHKYLFRVRKDTGTTKYDEIAAKLAHYCKMTGPNARITITGHSLGAALAAIFSLYASTEDRFTGEYGAIEVVTFGSPCIGNWRFAGAVKHQENIGKLRIAKFHVKGDSVPHLPPALIRWSSRGAQYWHSGIDISLPYIRKGKIFPVLLGQPKPKITYWDPDEESYIGSLVRQVRSYYVWNLPLRFWRFALFHTLVEHKKRMGLVSKSDPNSLLTKCSLKELYDMREDLTRRPLWRRRRKDQKGLGPPATDRPAGEGLT